MTEGALQAAVTVLPMALRRSRRPWDGAPIREVVRVPGPEQRPMCCRSIRH
jgi:hypothetical protein